MTGSDVLDAAAGPINTPAGAAYTTTWPIGAVTSQSIQARAARVATLTLLAGIPGTYQLTLNGSGCSADAGETFSLPSGPGFETRVGGQ